MSTVDQANAQSATIDNPLAEIQTTLTEERSGSGSEAVKLALKIDGTPMEKEFTKEELANLVQAGMVSTQRFQEAAEMKRKAEALENDYRLKIAEVDEIFNSLEAEKPAKTNKKQPNEERMEAPAATDPRIAKRLEQLEFAEISRKAEIEVGELAARHGLNDTDVKEVIQFAIQNKMPNLEAAYRVVFFDKAKNLSERELMERLHQYTPSGGRQNTATETPEMQVKNMILGRNPGGIGGTSL